MPPLCGDSVGQGFAGVSHTQVEVCEMQGEQEGQGDGSAEPATFWLCMAKNTCASCTLAWCHILLCPLGVSDTCHLALLPLVPMAIGTWEGRAPASPSLLTGERV